ncbi:MAG: hypothetical protein A2729_03935 [Candidatus Buchananbacteria bacterium RIFCSPHIGHO2_01_FULL_39_14]|uniref:Uncharacterized protein n=2 Tax=Candidatus Buchananiibacteriota TaxID=1817903 RepID=A0A1G1YUK4_9BACT|nr:MAG: hypothetical protein A2729_03935 [Candidatus Buchananbacteria bacterium RIFCSPHIGHO2_01_FULL_39_14]OGY48618.1 MAG: hypothetical protein A3D39_05130 [Candidatus Buchananbacteria bacterium RIFCSPHIGHO2_02_FULL_39_17]OGY56043.1 MAG: hypothetical protein A2912_03510 [Candidatus Buchananbacteria bacterium RIFCSPLOWO2_01_FULL_40_23b]
MTLLNHFIPVFTPILILILIEILLQKPRQIYWLVPFACFLIILSLFQLTGKKIKNEKFWRYLITPILFFLSGTTFFVFLDGIYFRQGVAIALVIALAVYLEVIFLWFCERLKYQAHSLENISVHLNLVTIFLTASSLVGLVIFIGLPLWLMIIIFVFFVTLLNYELIWSSGVAPKLGWLYSLVITLAMTEIFWAVNFLPTSVYVDGLIISLSYYLITGLARNWLIGVKEKKVIKRYLFVSLICLLIVFLTAKWF